MTRIPMPGIRPADARFSSGPTKKRPGWNLQALEGALLGRSHRSKPGKAKLKEAIDRTRALLGVPADFKIAIVPASDTGAVEMALWSMLGARPGRCVRLGELRRRVGDRCGRAADSCRIAGFMSADLMACCRICRLRAATADIVFTQNGTTSGARIPNFDWIPANREGITINDATSARLRAAHRLVEMRRGDLLLAESAGRGGGARHVDSVAARGGAVGELCAAAGRCRRFSA